MSYSRIQLAPALLAGRTMLGCEKKRAPLAMATIIETPSTQPAGSQTVAGRGSIHGKAIFSGKAPAPRAINNQICHGNGPKPIFEDSLVVNSNGTLRNVVVFLKDIPGDTAIS